MSNSYSTHVSGTGRSRRSRREVGDIDLLTVFERDVRPLLNLEAVFGELPGARISGGKLRARCPLHGGKHLNFAVDLGTLCWRCHSKCNDGGGPLDFMHRVRGGTGRVRGKAFAELVQCLCARFGIQMGRIVPERLDSSEVESVWAAASPVTEDAIVSKWLANERGLDAELIATLDIARVLDGRKDLPSWAGYERDGWQSWPSVGYRVIVPLVDAHGEMRALRFRKPQHGAKGRSATGISGIGLVMADALARSMLAISQPPECWNSDPLSVLIAEGEPDFWSWTTEPARRGMAHGALSFPAIIGIVSGSFDASIAARLPVGCQVISAVDHDEGGERIHARIARIVGAADRGFVLQRWSQP